MPLCQSGLGQVGGQHRLIEYRLKIIGQTSHRRFMLRALLYYGQIDMSSNDLSNPSHTHWAALEAMADAGIDYSEIPPLEVSLVACLEVPNAAPAYA